jgi:hypothetical protein
MIKGPLDKQKYIVINLHRSYTGGSVNARDI